MSALHSDWHCGQVRKKHAVTSGLVQRSGSFCRREGKSKKHVWPAEAGERAFLLAGTICGGGGISGGGGGTNVLEASAAGFLFLFKYEESLMLTAAASANVGEVGAEVGAGVGAGSRVGGRVTGKATARERAGVFSNEVVAVMGLWLVREREEKVEPDAEVKLVVIA